MSKDDLIRRGDATKIANHLGFLDNPDSVAYAVSEAINAIPAVQPTVTPDDVAALVEALEWIMNNRGLCYIPSEDWDDKALTAITRVKSKEGFSDEKGVV